ncbi:hypothetical protein KKB69_01485 [Patescibacteria group bacterium]|nr:hypothetical protein [Patescibacteria group bacterium]
MTTSFFRTFTKSFKKQIEKRKKISNLKKEKGKLLREVPVNKIRRFRELCEQIREGNGTKRKRKEVLSLRRELEELGLKKIYYKIKKINRKISDLI